MSWIDWLVIAIPFTVIVGVGVKAQGYVTGVSDFLSAGRSAGRYLIGVASGEAMLGLVTVVAYFELYYNSGWSFFFWQNLVYAAVWIMAITGFVNYRYRETRCLTLAQFFEKRYSRKFRIFAGVLMFISGLLNYALFPAVGGRFLIYYCNLPDTIVLGPLNISMFGFLMAICLIVALLITLSGGQLTTMVTDCVQGIFTYFVFTVLLVVVILLFSQAQFEYALTEIRPEGRSLLNPFDISDLSSFNMLFVFIAVFSMVYSRMAWQGTQGYNCCGASPHEQKMGGLIASWRYAFTPIMTIVLVLAAFTFLNHPDFAAGASAVHDELAGRIPEATIRNQMLVPVTLRTLLPVGCVGGFAAVMVFMMISTDTTYLHSWGSILIQDVVMPFRKKPFTTKVQMLLLRLAILFVACFAWVFSMFFGQFDFIIMFFTITGSLYLGGAGSVIIGGLYWRRGTTPAAYVAMSIGAIIACGGLFLQKTWKGNYADYPEWYISLVNNTTAFLNAHLGGLGRWEVSPERFPITSQEFAFVAMVLAIFLYITISWLTCRKKYDLDQLLHRGKYNLEHRGDAGAAVGKQKLSWRNIFGITDEYTKGDRIVAYCAVGWVFYGLAVFAFIVISNLCFGIWSERAWFNLWRFYTVPLALLVGVVTAVWFTWGGIRDLLRLFRSLKTMKTNPQDDGWVEAGDK